MIEKKPGRPKTTTHAVGSWAWNADNFNSKIVYGEATASEPDPCDIWQGATGPYGGLFGAFKLGRGQMTQARRIAYMQATGQNIDDKSIYATKCMNPDCVKASHMTAKPNRARGLRNNG